MLRAVGCANCIARRRLGVSGSQPVRTPGHSKETPGSRLFAQRRNGAALLSVVLCNGLAQNATSPSEIRMSGAEMSGRRLSRILSAGFCLKEVSAPVAQSKRYRGLPGAGKEAQ
jgi:hypothetical protein